MSLEGKYLEKKLCSHEKRLDELEKCLASIKAELRVNTAVTIAILAAILSLIIRAFS